MNFGPFTERDDSFAIMDQSLELGINFFDTANVYGWQLGQGVTESIIGDWFAQGGGRREQTILATKVYGKMGEGVNERGLSAYHIKQACEASLERLQTDHIDLYQMHHVDRDAPWDEIWQAMEQLVRLGLVSEQSLYNLSARMIELEVVPACREFGIGIIPWSPLAGGMLGGALQKAEEGRRAREWVQEKIDKHHSQLEEFESFCDEIGETPTTVSLAWLLANKEVTAPIIGPRNMEQLEGSLRCLEFELDQEALDKLDEIWPGPGGEAPEAYSW
jgi:aryl-alcohol dehydrogenase-like predicted oxidoreductase